MNAETFWARVDKSGGAEACWECTGARDRQGYAYAYSPITGKTSRAHRAAWIYTYGQIDSGLQVCHRCDNPACCNPSHLFLGTDAENKADMDGKGRRARGSRQGHAVLDEESVGAICGLINAGLSDTAIGSQFGVARAVIYLIRTRKNWRHVSDRVLKEGPATYVLTVEKA